MAWGRFGFGNRNDDLPIDDWMDDRNAEVAQQDDFDAAGRKKWDNSTRSGDYLDALRDKLRHLPTAPPARVVAVTGGGGVGKSTLVGRLIEVARNHGQSVH